MNVEMVREALVLTAVSGLVVTSSAAAYTVTRPNGQVRPVATAWAEASLEPLPHEAGIVLNTNRRDVAGACYGNSACTSPEWPSIYLDPRYGSVRATFFHELGHRFDYTRLTDANRARFRELAHIRPKRPWRGVPNAPAERFAEAYGLCSLGREPRLPLTPTRVSNRINGAYGYSPTVRQHRRICHWLRRFRAATP
jgi:hypothetical protein